MPSLNVNEALFLSSIAVLITFIIFHSVQIKSSHQFSPELQILSQNQNQNQNRYTKPQTKANQNNNHTIKFIHTKHPKHSQNSSKSQLSSSSIEPDENQMVPSNESILIKSTKIAYTPSLHKNTNIPLISNNHDSLNVNKKIHHPETFISDNNKCNESSSVVQINIQKQSNSKLYTTTNDYIDIETKYVVQGYIRQTHQLLPQQHNLHLNIPLLVSDLCLAYYYIEKEKFMKCSKNMKISNDDNYVQIKERSWCTAFGHILIDGIKNANSSYEWKLKIIECSTEGYYISLDPSYDLIKTHRRSYDRHTKIRKNKHFYEIKSNGEYKNGIKGGFDFNYGFGAAQDIITIKLNTSTKILEFHRKGLMGDEGVIIFDNVDLTHQYRIAVSIYGKNDCIQLIHCKQTLNA